MINFLKKIFNISDIRLNGSLYMKRYRFLPDSLPGLRLHKIYKSDIDRELHNHPWPFISIILKGGYYEYLSDGSCTWHGAGSVLFRKATTLHRLELPSTAITFVLRGRQVQEWGFLTEKGMVGWREFDKLKGR